MEAQDNSPAPAFRGQHKPKPLGFDPSKLKGLPEKLIRSHWENNYGGAVNALNGLEKRFDAMLSMPPNGNVKDEDIKTLVEWILAIE